jgi:large subunit ribosomal protein L6
MSKIGRKPIDIRDVQVSLQGQTVTYKGKKDSGSYVLPPELEASVEGAELLVNPSSKGEHLREINRIWGLHRSLLANMIQGARSEFERQLEIVGLGFKAVVSGKKIVFSLGYSHTIDFELPNKVAVEADKTGQLLTVKSSSKDLVGQVCSKIKSLRPPEPYKGTGIKYKSEVILRKAGKTKAA